MNVARRTAGGRARLLFTLLLLGLAGLVGRTSYLQVVRADEFAARARRQHFVDVPIPAVRGRILDRNGETLAGSYHSRSIAIDAVTAAAQGHGDWIPGWSARLALALGAPERTAEFAERIRAAAADRKRFCYLARWVDREVAERVLATDLPGLDVREEPRREYPHGAMAAAAIGVVGPGPDGRNAGLTGLEKVCDRWLRGEDGCRSVLRSGRREALYLFPECNREARSGRDIVVTIDLAVQQIVEQELDRLQETFTPKMACAIAMDPNTGEILALAGRPGFDPAEFPAIDRAALRIPAIHLAYEPGSTMKPLVMARALTAGAVRPDQTLDCGPGYRKFGWRVVRDVHPNGELDTAHVLIKSSNTGMAQIGLALGVESMHGLLGALRFGRGTGLPFDFEETGRVPPLAEWKEYEHDVSAAFGRGFMLTPVQLATAYCSLANGGRMIAPRLLRDHRERPTSRAGFSPAALEFVRAAMVRVVLEGTGRRARVAGLAIAGKTGTSEHYPKGSRRYDSSFAGFAPADDPRLVVVVVAHDPQRSKEHPRPYGGVVAAPVAGRIFRRAIPLLSARENAAQSESGVRQTVQTNKKKVRVAAVQRSSVSVGERISPAIGRNPDSEGVELCRSNR